jgi:bacillithiol biosynthesis cysteine-adding enzyme BshC
MECSCILQTDVPGTSKLFADLIYHFDRVEDLYPYPPGDLGAIGEAARFNFPAERRAALVRALTPLNAGNPSLAELAKPGTVAIVTGQQVGLFTGPAYTLYKGLSAIKAARDLAARGVPAVPVFWLATQDHDFDEVNHAWVFGSDHHSVRIGVETPSRAPRPVGGIRPGDFPVAAMRTALDGLPFADDAVALIERAYAPGETMGSAFARALTELLGRYGLLLVDPMEPAMRELAAPILREAVTRMPELADGVMARSKELVERGYHAQVLVDKQTSLVFLMQDGGRTALRRANGDFVAPHHRFSPAELADLAQDLSPNALLRPVVQDYMLPTAAYIGGPAELAYLAQSGPIYDALLGRRPVACPRAGFTIVDERIQRRMKRYHLRPTDLFVREQELRDMVAARLVPAQLKLRLEETQKTFSTALDALAGELKTFDVSLAAALDTSRRKIEYQVGKISRKTASQIIRRDEQAGNDSRSMSGLVYPNKHLQERLYSIVPFIAKFGPGIIDELYSAVKTDCADHQFVVV